MSREFGRAELDDRLRVKRHLQNESRRDVAGQRSLGEREQVSEPAPRGTLSRSGSYTLTLRELHERKLKLPSDLVTVW